MLDYLRLPRDQLYVRYARIVSELITLYTEIADVEADEMRERARAYAESLESTVTGRSQAAAVRAVLPATEAVGLRARRDALNEEKTFILRLIDDRNS